MNSKFKLNNFLARAGSGGLALALFAAMLVAVVAVSMTVTPREIAAKPAYATATGRPCTACHTAPPKLNACGKKYQKDHNTKC